MTLQVRLNLASGTDIRPRGEGWINLDAVEQWPGYPPCDIKWDARTDEIPFGDDSVDEVVAGYLLLHIAPRYHDQVLREIHRVVMPGGKVQFGEVEMDVAVRRWLEDPTDLSVCELIWGEQGYHEGNDAMLEFEWADKHCHGFTEVSLRQLLTNHGFRDIQRVKIHAPEVWYELTLECTK